MKILNSPQKFIKQDELYYLNAEFFGLWLLHPAADVDFLEIYTALETVFEAYLQKEL